MVVTSTPSAVVIFSHCKKPGHRFQNCFKRNRTMSGKTSPPTPRKKSSCSLHSIDRHDNSVCRSQMRDDNITRRPRPGQQNGPHHDLRAHANTTTTSTSTTQMEAYVPGIHAPFTTAAATTAAPSTSIATPLCPTSPPVGIRYSSIAAPPINIAAQPVNFCMTADSGASSHLIDKQILPGIFWGARYNHLKDIKVPDQTRLERKDMAAKLKWHGLLAKSEYATIQMFL